MPRQDFEIGDILYLDIKYKKYIVVGKKYEKGELIYIVKLFLDRTGRTYTYECNMIGYKKLC